MHSGTGKTVTVVEAILQCLVCGSTGSAVSAAQTPIVTLGAGHITSSAPSVYPPPPRALLPRSSGAKGANAGPPSDAAVARLRHQATCRARLNGLFDGKADLDDNLPAAAAARTGVPSGSEAKSGVCILACAPSDYACDVLVDRLALYLDPPLLLRLNAPDRYTSVKPNGTCVVCCISEYLLCPDPCAW